MHGFPLDRVAHVARHDDQLGLALGVGVGANDHAVVARHEEVHPCIFGIRVHDHVDPFNCELSDAPAAAVEDDPAIRRVVGHVARPIEDVLAERQVEGALRFSLRHCFQKSCALRRPTGSQAICAISSSV